MVFSPHIAILALAAGLRFYRIGEQSLWADEGNSVAMALRGLGQIAQHAAADIHPPLYYWLLHIWVRVFGTSEAALRSLSAVFGVVLVYVIYLIGRRLRGEQVGVTAALIAAINPFLIYYAQEARMYALLGLWSGLAIYALTLYVLAEGAGRMRPSRGLAALLVISLAGGLYTHYAFPAIILAINVLYLLWLWDSHRRGYVMERLLWWWGLHLVAGLLFLPWLPIAQRQLTTWPSPETRASLGQVLSAALVTLSLGPVGYRQAMWPWNTAFAMGVALGLWPSVRPARGRREHWLAWGIPFVTMAAPIVLIVARGLFTEAYLKFLIVGSPGFCLLLARGIIGPGEALADAAISRLQSGRRRRRGTSAVRVPWLQLLWYAFAAALLGMASGTILQAYYFDPEYARDDYRGIAQYIQAEEKEGDRIILEAPGQYEVFTYYYKGRLSIHPLPRQRPPDVEALRDELTRLTAAPGRIFALFWATEQADPQHIVENWLAQAAFKASDTWRGNVRFAVYAIPDFDIPRERTTPTNWRFGDPPLLRLRGVGLGGEIITAGEVFPVSLVWEAIRPIAERYKVTVQLLDGRDQVVAQRDAEPGGGTRPTTTWTPGQPVEDGMGIIVRPGTPPGAYRLILAVYRATDGVRLPVSDGGEKGDHIVLGTVRVQRPEEPPALITLGMQRARRLDFGPIQLLGFDVYKRGFRHAPDTPLYPGDRLHIALYWRAREAPGRKIMMRLELGKGKAVVEADLVGEAYPTTQWTADEIVRGDHDLLVPSDLPPGEYPLFLTLLEDGRPLGSRARLTAITVQTSPSPEP
jgi:4-amino-4-deoxy-L-arabinose transferase-like glycosyltransferase